MSEITQTRVQKLNALCQDTSKRKLVVGEKEYWISPKTVSQESDYFKAMFSGSFMESEEAETKIDLPHPDHFDPIYVFLHTGNGFSHKNPFRVRKRANFYPKKVYRMVHCRNLHENTLLQRPFSCFENVNKTYQCVVSFRVVFWRVVFEIEMASFGSLTISFLCEMMASQKVFYDFKPCFPLWFGTKVRTHVFVVLALPQKNARKMWDSICGWDCCPKKLPNQMAIGHHFQHGSDH